MEPCGTSRPHPEGPTCGLLWMGFFFFIGFYHSDLLIYAPQMRQKENYMTKIIFHSGEIYESEGAVSVYEAAKNL